MNSMNLYIKTTREVSEIKMKLLFSGLLGKNHQLFWEGNFGRLILENANEQFVDLKLSYHAIVEDLYDEVTFVVVPRFQKEIAQIVKTFTKKGLYPFTQELPRLLIESPGLRNELLSFTDEVSEDVLQTIQVYLELNMSVNLVARTMYTHRNTINYRISRFIELTGIDIRSNTNGYYVYTLITWQNG